MSSYSLSGSGTHALTASTTGLQVTITTPSSIGGLGRSNPVAKYDQGLIRFSDGTSYWPPVAVLGGPQFIPVPANATSFGFALLGGAAISVVEVIGGTVFFSGGASSLASLSDVTLASLADAQVLAWNAAAGKWENVAPGGGGSGLYSAILLYQDQKTAGTSGGTFTSGGWRQRDINTEVADSGGHGSVASNQITLDAGTYDAFITCPAHQVDRHLARLFDVTNSAVLLWGTSELSAGANDVTSRSIITGPIALSGSTVVRIEHSSQSTKSGDGFGVQTNAQITGGVDHETYTIAEFRKRA